MDIRVNLLLWFIGFMKFSFPGKTTLDAVFTALQGRERIAGVVIEETRVRVAELVPQGPDRSPAVIAEGAVPLPMGAIREGKLADRNAVSNALQRAFSQAKPTTPATRHVILSIPVLPLFTKTVQIPATVSEEERRSLLQLEAEGILPISPSDAFIDWQLVAHRPGEQGSEEGVHEFVVMAARRQDVVPYVEAASRAGLTVVAAEPFVLSIARGLLPDPARPSIIVYLFSDAVFAAAIEEDAVRFPHHAIIDAATPASRAEAIAQELTTFVRFLKPEDHARHLATQRMLVDGTIDDATLASLALFSQGDISLSFATIEHELSKAAIRGSALRGIVSRSDDRFINLMATRTQEAYAQSLARFFLHLTANIVTAGVLVAALISLATFAMVSIQERAVGRAPSEQISPETARLLAEMRMFNTTVSETRAAYAQTDTAAFMKALSLLKGALAPELISLQQFRVTRTGTVEISGVAHTVETYLELHDRVNQSALFTARVSPKIVIPDTNIPFTFSLQLTATSQ